jgi:hypothetical protein
MGGASRPQDEPAEAAEDLEPEPEPEAEPEPEQKKGFFGKLFGGKKKR